MKKRLAVMTRRSHRLAAVGVGAHVFKLEILGLVGGLLVTATEKIHVKASSFI